MPAERQLSAWFTHEQYDVMEREAQTAGLKIGPYARQVLLKAHGLAEAPLVPEPKPVAPRVRKGKPPSAPEVAPLPARRIRSKPKLDPGMVRVFGTDGHERVVPRDAVAPRPAPPAPKPAAPLLGPTSTSVPAIKRALRSMLEEALANTAKLPIE